MFKRITSLCLAAIMICAMFSISAFAAASPTKGARRAGTSLSSVWVSNFDAKTGKLTINAGGRGIRQISVMYQKRAFKVAEDDFGHKYFAADADKTGNWQTLNFNGTNGELQLDKNGIYAIKVAAIGRGGRQTAYMGAENAYVAEVDPKYEEKEKAFNVKADKIDPLSGYQIMHDTDKKMRSEEKVTVETAENLDKTVDGLKSGKCYASVRPFLQLISNENKKENEKYDVTKDTQKTVETFYGARSDTKELNIK